MKTLKLYWTCENKEVTIKTKFTISRNNIYYYNFDDERGEVLSVISNHGKRILREYGCSFKTIYDLQWYCF